MKTVISDTLSHRLIGYCLLLLTGLMLAWSSSHLAAIANEYWRWWVVRLWVEGSSKSLPLS